jgi:hypothetical protein
MAVGIRIKLGGVTEEQFDAVNKHVDPAGDPSKGLTPRARSTKGGA